MKVKAIIGCLAILIFGVNMASATSINSLFQNGINNLQDNSGENIIDHTSSPSTLDIDDVLKGDLVINSINNTNIGSANPYNELTAHFEVMVSGKTSLIGGQTTPTGNLYQYTFAPTAANSGSGAMVWIYEDSANDADFATGTGFVGPNPAWGILGITDSDTKWTANTDTDNLLTLNSEMLDSDPTHGNFNILLDFLVNNSGLQFNDVGSTGVQITGAGHFEHSTSSAYQVEDQTNFLVNAVVPEPASMLLLGLGLLGLALVSRPHRKGN
jgi:hypothetical protein